VPTSDIDTRAYVQCCSWLPVNVFNEAEEPVGLHAFIQQSEVPLVRKYNWWSFNEPAYRQMSDELDRSVSFGFIDVRYASFLFDRLLDGITEPH
jgi:hypothetical protein